MATSEKHSSAQRVIIVGDLLGRECLCGLPTCCCQLEPILASSASQLLRNQKDVPVVLVLCPGRDWQSEWVEQWRLAQASVAILGVESGFWSQELGDIADLVIKLDQLDAAAAWLPGLVQLSRARQRLRSQQKALEQQSRLLDQVSMAVIGADLNGLIKAWNRRAEEMFNLSSSEAMHQSLSVIFEQGASRDFTLHKILEPLLIHDQHQFEIDLTRRDGGQFPVHIALSLERNAQRDIVGIICCCRDISLRRRAEMEKREAYQRLSFAIERMPLGFIEWGMDYNIRAWNKSAEAIFGYSQKEALGQPFSILVESGYIEECRKIFAAMRESKSGNRSRNQNLTRDKRLIMCDWNNTVLLDDRGNVVGYASIVEDITEQIRIEQELMESREAARAANRSKDEFLAVMSHEVRTPMNSIIGFADLLMESLKDAEQAELLNIIKANAFNLLELISNVLNYSRLEAGEVSLREQETDLMALFHEIEEVTHAEATEKGLSFAVDIRPETPRMILADYTELRQVLLNLVANAMKFTNEGGVKVRVSAKPLPRDNPWRWELVFAVEDTGIGIDEQQKDKLFQSFTQLDSSSTRRFGGTGLGLAICRRIVELWQGHIWAEKNAGPGSTFYFTLPTQENSSEARDVNEQIYEEIEDQRFAEIYPMRILLLSPTQATAEIMEHIMASLGYDLTVQFDAIESISHLQDSVYDVLLIDDDIKDFSFSEVVELVRNGQAGEANRAARLVVLHEQSPQNKDSSVPFQMSMVSIAKPVIARNVRLTLRKIALARDAEDSEKG